MLITSVMSFAVLFIELRHQGNLFNMSASDQLQCKYPLLPTSYWSQWKHPIVHNVSSRTAKCILTRATFPPSKLKCVCLQPRHQNIKAHCPLSQSTKCNSNKMFRLLLFFPLQSVFHLSVSLLLVSFPSLPVHSVGLGLQWEARLHR